MEARREASPAGAGRSSGADAVSAARAVVLVEGLSDRAAVEAAARRYGGSPAKAGVVVLAVGGAHAVGRTLEDLARRRPRLRLGGLYDAAEEASVARGLERAGLGRDLTRPDLARLGFHVCEADLEDELLRAVGTAGALRVVEAQGELRSFRTLQRQPAQRGRREEDQLRRFLGSGSGRKIRYARLLVEAVDLARMPRPLRAVLASAGLPSDPATGAAP